MLKIKIFLLNLSNFINEIGAMNANESNIPISRIIAIDVIKLVFP